MRKLFPAILAVLVLGACAGMNQRDINTATGAVIGGAVGNIVTGGSAIGTVGGAAVGGVVGNQATRQRR